MRTITSLAHLARPIRLSRTSRRATTPRRQYLEALEPRTLLSAAFSSADAAGTWALIGADVSGSIVIDASGNIVGGSYRAAQTPQSHHRNPRNSFSGHSATVATPGRRRYYRMPILYLPNHRAPLQAKSHFLVKVH